MKLLYIGCYRDGTGWAHAAQNYILSLDAAGVDVVPRFIKLNENHPPIPERIQELEKKSDKNCDFVVQHVLPHHMSYNGSFEKNIALYVTETSHCKNTCWPERIDLMDEAWVPNNFMAKESSVNSGIITPHFVIPHASNMNKYQQQYDKIDISELRNKFVFYYIGEINRRKNIPALLKAFHLEFRPEEDVAIVLKAHAPGQSPQESESILYEMSANIKNGLKLYKEKEFYHKEVFITDYISDEQIMSLHANFDCFASASLGEAWGIPVFDAMAMGKTPICTDTGGPKDFLKSGGGYLVKSEKEPCFGMVETFDEIYVANEDWDRPNISSLRSCMRKAFEDKEDKERRAEIGVEESYKYSYANVGEIMKSALEGKASPAYKGGNSIKYAIQGLKS